MVTACLNVKKKFWSICLVTQRSKESVAALLKVYCRLLLKHDSLLFYQGRMAIWLQSVTVILNSQNSKVLLQSINQLLRRNKISFLA